MCIQGTCPLISLTFCASTNSDIPVFSSPHESSPMTRITSYVHLSHAGVYYFTPPGKVQSIVMSMSVRLLARITQQEAQLKLGVADRTAP